MIVFCILAQGQNSTAKGNDNYVVPRLGTQVIVILSFNFSKGDGPLNFVSLFVCLSCF